MHKGRGGPKQKIKSLNYTLSVQPSLRRCALSRELISLHADCAFPTLLVKILRVKLGVLVVPFCLVPGPTAARNGGCDLQSGERARKKKLRV